MQLTKEDLEEIRKALEVWYSYNRDYGTKEEADRIADLLFRVEHELTQ